MNVLASLAVLGFLIVFHESGHFLAATLQGIRVNGFSIGFGPALIKKQIKGVTYAIRALPLGGFVSFPDDDQESNIPKDDPDLLKNRPIPQRALVISAGVLANLFLAWAVLIGQASFVGLPSDPDPGVVVISVQNNEAAANAGLTAGDRILKIDNVELGKGQDAVQKLVKKIKSSAGKEIKIERVQENKIQLISITPSEYLGEGKVGAQLQPNLTGDVYHSKNIFEIVNYSNSQFTTLLSRTIKGYQGLFTNFGETAQQLSGPVKIVEIGAQLSEQGGSGLMLFASLVSINLAVLNSLPLPLLDGGQFFLLLIEGVRGKPIPERIQLAFIQSGFLLIVGLSIVLIIRDTTQLTLVKQIIGR